MARKSRRWQLLALPLILGLVASGLLGGCQRASSQETADQASDVQVTLTVEPDPPHVGPSRVTVTLLDAGKDIVGATVHIRGDMGHAGMRPVEADTTGNGMGAYQAGLDWSMAGDWIVTVTASLPDGRTTTRQFDVTVNAL